MEVWGSDGLVCGICNSFFSLLVNTDDFLGRVFEYIGFSFVDLGYLRSTYYLYHDKSYHATTYLSHFSVSFLLESLAR